MEEVGVLLPDESGDLPTHKVIPVVTDDDILRMATPYNTLKQVRNRGAFLFNEPVDESNIKSEAFFISVFLLQSRDKRDKVIDNLSKRYKAKKPEDGCRLNFEELEAIEEHASRYIAYMQRITRESMDEVKQAEEEQGPTEIDLAADEIINRQAVMEHFLKTFKTRHAGDEESAKVMMLVSMAGSSLTSEGIHFHATGKKGTGKTTAIRAFLSLWPEEYVMAGEFSLKGLYYHKVKQGHAIWPDDSYANPESESHIKRAMSTFQEPTIYYSVGKGDNGSNEGLTFTIPPRVCFFGSNTGKPGSDELADRQYRISMIQTPEGDKAFWEYLKKRIKTGEGAGHDSEDVLICRAILRKFKGQRFKVIIPFADRMEFTSLEIRRDIEMFLSFVDAVTVMNYAGREQMKGEDSEGEFTILTATEADFLTACRIFKASENQGGRKMQLSQDEMNLAIWMSKQMDFDSDGILEQDILKKYGELKGMGRTAIKRLLTGRNGNGGLINQIPGAHAMKVSDMETEAEETEIRGKIITKRRGKSQNLYFVPRGMTPQTAVDDFGFVYLKEVK